MRSVRGYASILVNGKIAILMRLLPHVADATDRAQMRRKIITELGAHTSHMHVDRTRESNASREYTCPACVTKNASNAYSR